MKCYYAFGLTFVRVKIICQHQPYQLGLVSRRRMACSTVCETRPSQIALSILANILVED